MPPEMFCASAFAAPAGPGRRAGTGQESLLKQMFPEHVAAALLRGEQVFLFLQDSYKQKKSDSAQRRDCYA
jgi:hypothetical protein